MKLKLIFLLVISQLSYSQIWMNSVEGAKQVAKKTNKFILIDFNAAWCKPCGIMDIDYWHNPKYKETLDKFIIVSVDIDKEKEIAKTYHVVSIPNIKVIDVNENIVYELTGFDTAEKFNDEIKYFPSNTEDLYRSLDFKNYSNPSDEELLNVATNYQVLLQKSNEAIKSQFFRISNHFFDECIKNTTDSNYKEVSELGKLFNLTIIDRNKKVIKNIEISNISDKNKSYAHYILAKANYQENLKNIAEKNILEVEKLNNENWVTAAKQLRLKYNKSVKIK